MYNERMSADTRLVPLSRERVWRLGLLLDDLDRGDARAREKAQHEIDVLLSDWIAAPADPEEAAVAALIARYPNTVWTGRFSEDAFAVLAALGYESGDKPA